ncbi:hypothetical protein QMA69_30435, partial [Burkholderia pseudomallei]|nr:hypothetical protein [Burkholderia pseudomallei]
ALIGASGSGKSTLLRQIASFSSSDALPPLLPPMPQSAPLPPAAQPGSSLPNDNAPMSPTPTPDAPAAGGSN